MTTRSPARRDFLRVIGVAGLAGIARGANGSASAKRAMLREGANDEAGA
jgi:hypothetical protein